MKLKPYPKYKPSGVEWLGDVPADWAILALKYVVSMQSGEQITAEDIDSIGDYPVFGGNGLRGYTQRFTHDGFYALIGRQGALCGNVNYARGQFWASEHAVVVTPLQECSTVWLGELLRTMNLGQYSMTAAQPGLSVDTIGKLRIPLPPTNVQAAIGAYIERETAKIDTLIAKQEKLIDVLLEKRQAVISHAVTKGLDPTVPMKPGGVEWLGDVPEHWRVCQIRRVLTRIEQGWSPECYNFPSEEGSWGVLRAGCVNRGVFNADDNKALPEQLDPDPQLEVSVGDVLVSRASGSSELVGSTAYVASCRPRLMLSDKIFRMHFDRTVDKRFFVLVMNSRSIRLQIERAISGAEGLANNLPQSALRTFLIPLPPIEEQREAVLWVQNEVTKIDTLIAKAQQAIELQKEHRTALISAAVTGKIDVRGMGDQESYEEKAA